MGDDAHVGAVHRGRWFRSRATAAKWALAAALIAWLLASGRLDLRLVARAGLSWPIAAMFVLKILALTLTFWRWQLLARAIRLDVSFRDALHAGITGTFLSIGLPSVVGWDASRVYHATRLNPGHHVEALSSVVADRAIALLALVATAIALLGALALGSSPAVGWTIGALAAGTGAVVALAVIVTRRAARPGAWSDRWPTARRAVDALASYRQAPRTVLQAFLLSCVTQLLTAGTAVAAFAAMGIATRLSLVFALSPVVELSRALPLTPMGLGVVDSLASVLFASVSVGAGAECVLLQRVVHLLVAAASGIAYLLPVSRSRKGGSRGLATSVDPGAP